MMNWTEDGITTERRHGSSFERFMVYISDFDFKKPEQYLA